MTLENSRKFDGKLYLYHNFASNKQEAENRKREYSIRGYLVRIIKNPSRAGWYRIYIRHPRNGTTIKYDGRSMPIYIKG